MKNLRTGTAKFDTIRAKDANGLSIQDDGGNGIFIKDGGNVGIGITDPSEELSILGNIKIVKNLTGSPANGDILGSIAFEGTNSVNTNLQAEAKIEAIAEEAHGAETAATGLQFYTKKTGTGPGSQPSPSMRIDSAGNVGIGTKDPGGRLHVVGDFGDPSTSNLITRLSQSSGNGVCDIGFMAVGATSGGSWFQSRNSSDSSKYALLFNPEGGNVGIGTTNPGGKLTVAGDMYLGTYSSTASADNKMYYIKSAPYNWTGVSSVTDDIAAIGMGAALTGHDDGIITFHTATNVNEGGSLVERMRITSTGNVGIGTTNPLSKLQIDGGNTSNSTYAFSVTGASGATLKPSVQMCYDNGSTSYTMILGKGSRSSGYILGATNISNALCFQMLSNGDLQNTNNAYGQLSDIKLKENVVNATPKLEDLNKVRVVNFNLKGDNRKQIGVIAQELEEIFPGLVDDVPDHDEDGNLLETTTKSVKYSVFGPILIKAIQEQQSIIEDLKSQNASLESRISALES